MRFRETEFPAVWTGLLFGEFVCLLLEEELKCSFGEALGGSGGNLLEGSEIDIESRPVVTECPFGNDFGPLSRECSEFLEFLGCESRCGHGLSCLDVTSIVTTDFLSQTQNHAQTHANRDVTSCRIVDPSRHRFPEFDIRIITNSQPHHRTANPQPWVTPMPTTIIAGFDKLRQNLEISGLQAATVSTRQQNARANVAKEMEVNDDFLTGSYVRNTLIGPLNNADVDVFIELHSKYFSQDGYTALLDKVRGVLKKSYTEATDISRNGQAVTIKFSNFAMDIVPGFNRMGGGYLIPDSRGKKWIQTDPKKHVEIWSQRNDQHDGKLIPLIKMIKGWNKTHSALFRSFHLETLILKIFASNTFGTYADGARYFFEQARTQVEYVVSDVAGYGDDIGRYLLEKNILADVKTRLQSAYDRSLEAQTLAAANKIEAAYTKWRMIFSDYFPAYG